MNIQNLAAIALIYVFCAGCDSSDDGHSQSPSTAEGNPQQKDNLPPGERIPLENGPYLQNVKPHEITVMWTTSQPGPSRVDYGRTAEYGQSVTGASEVKIHEVTITDLETESSYHYRVVSTFGEKVAYSEDHTFQTAPYFSTPFRAAVYGDSRTGVEVHREIIDNMMAQHPELVIHTGDFISEFPSPYRDTYNLWQTEFFQPAAPLLAEVPFFPALGNHEEKTTSLGETAEGDIHWYFDFFSVPAASSASTTEAWYSFNYGCAHITVIDTCADFSPGSGQYSWLQEDLSSDITQNAAWRIVVGHHPIYSSGPHRNDPQSQALRDHIAPLFEEYKVKMVFAGHDHAYIRSFKNGIHYIVSAGGGANLYPIVDPPPEQRNGESTFHHVMLDISQSQIVLQARRRDRSLIESLVVKP